jgi:transcriptional regulator with XRE-family HTH domain
MSDFATFLKSEISARFGGSMAEMAEHLGVSETQLYRWTTGQKPRLEAFESVLALLGGDLARAFPSYSINEGEMEYKPSDKKPIYRGGKIQPDGSAALSYDPQNSEPLFANGLQSIKNLCELSPLWKLADQSAPLMIFTKDKIRLFAVAPASEAIIPDGTNVIIEHMPTGERKMGRIFRNKNEATLWTTNTQTLKAPTKDLPIFALIVGQWTPQ